MLLLDEAGHCTECYCRLGHNKVRDICLNTGIGIKMPLGTHPPTAYFSLSLPLTGFKQQGWMLHLCFLDEQILDAQRPDTQCACAKYEVWYHFSRKNSAEFDMLADFIFSTLCEGKIAKSRAGLPGSI